MVRTFYGIWLALLAANCNQTTFKSENRPLGEASGDSGSTTTQLEYDDASDDSAPKPMIISGAYLVSCEIDTASSSDVKTEGWCSLHQAETHTPVLLNQPSDVAWYFKHKDPESNQNATITATGRHDDRHARWSAENYDASTFQVGAKWTVEESTLVVETMTMASFGPTGSMRSASTADGIVYRIAGPDNLNPLIGKIADEEPTCNYGPEFAKNVHDIKFSFEAHEGSSIDVAIHEPCKVDATGMFVELYKIDDAGTLSLLQQEPILTRGEAESDSLQTFQFSVAESGKYTVMINTKNNLSFFIESATIEVSRTLSQSIDFQVTEYN